MTREKKADPVGCWVCAVLGRFQCAPAQWLLRNHLRKQW